jgi:hypothetical protein
MSEIIDYAQGTAMVLGGGYDLPLRSVKLSALEPVQKITEGHGPDELELKFIESTSQFSEFLDVGVESALDSLVFSASAKAQFVQETRINEYSLMLLVHVRCIKGVEIVDRPRLNAQAKALVAAQDFVGLRNSFGDHYISALTRGGELFGAIRITARSISEKEALRAELAASGFGWSTRAQLEAKLSAISASTTIEVNAKINGITNYTAPTNASALLRLAEQFPQLVTQSGTPIKVELRPLGELPEVQQASSAVSDATRLALLQLSNHYLDYLVLANNIAFMLSSQGAGRFDFDHVSRDTVQAQRAKVDAKLRELSLLSSKLLRAEILPNDQAVVGFVPAYVFDNGLTLPNPIEVRDLPNWSIYPLTRNTRGDAEMDGHSPRINLDANLSVSQDGRTLGMTVRVLMKESKKDWTTFEDSRSDIVFDLRNSGYKILEVRPSTGVVRAQAGEDDHDWHWYGGTGLLHQAHCRSDVRGKETGKIGADVIDFTPIRILIAPLEPLQPTRTPNLGQLKIRRESLSRAWLRRIR